MTKKPNRAQRRKSELLKATEALVAKRSREARNAGYREGESSERERLTQFINPGDFGKFRREFERPIFYLQKIEQPIVRVYDVPELSYQIRDIPIEVMAQMNVHEFRAEPLDRVLPNGTRIRWYNWTMVR
jgi:hypothetical protein